jgi:hypothetical protein
VFLTCSLSQPASGTDLKSGKQALLLYVICWSHTTDFYLFFILKQMEESIAPRKEKGEQPSSGARIPERP